MMIMALLLNIVMSQKNNRIIHKTKEFANENWQVNPTAISFTRTNNDYAFDGIT